MSNADNSPKADPTNGFKGSDIVRDKGIPSLLPKNLPAWELLETDGITPKEFFAACDTSIFERWFAFGDIPNRLYRRANNQLYDCGVYFWWWLLSLPKERQLQFQANSDLLVAEAAAVSSCYPKAAFKLAIPEKTPKKSRLRRSA